MEQGDYSSGWLPSRRGVSGSLRVRPDILLWQTDRVCAWHASPCGWQTPRALDQVPPALAHVPAGLRQPPLALAQLPLAVSLLLHTGGKVLDSGGKILGSVWKIPPGSGPASCARVQATCALIREAVRQT